MSIIDAEQVVEQLKVAVLTIVQNGIVQVAQAEIQSKEDRTCEVELEYITEEDYLLVRHELTNTLGYQVSYDKANKVMKVSWLKEYLRQLGKKTISEVEDLVGVTHSLSDFKATVNYVNQNNNVVHGDMSGGDLIK